MKWGIIFFFILLVFVSSSSAQVQLLSSDDVFTVLKENDNRGKAVFTLDNPVGTVSKNVLSISFNEVCGRVKSYELLVEATCYLEVPVYDVREDCYVDTNTSKKVCHDESYIASFDSQPYTCYKPITEVSSGVRDYKIEADIEFGKCNGRLGYEIDWIPKLTVSGKTFERRDWAWWNTSWDYSYSITPSTIQDLEIYNLSINGTKCENRTNTTRILNSANTSTYDFVWQNASKELLAFVGDNSSDYWLYCDDDLNIGEGNNSDKIILWMDCDGTDIDDSDWTTEAHATVSCQNTVVKNGANSFYYVTDDTSSLLSYVDFPVATSGNVTVTAWVRKDSDEVDGRMWLVLANETGQSNSYDTFTDKGGTVNLNVVDPGVVDTGVDISDNTWYLYALRGNASGNNGTLYWNNTIIHEGSSWRGTTTGLQYFMLTSNVNNDKIWVDDLFICKEKCFTYYTAATITIGSEVAQTTDTCTYSSGNHIFQGVDSCTPVTTDFGGNNVTFNGTGTTLVESGVVLSNITHSKVWGSTLRQTSSTIRNGY